jgi:molybdopterin-guanine dinucleotide biosynthesis protein A
MANDTFPIIILAGGKTPEKILAAGETETDRAFLKIGDRPMLQWVLDAIRSSKAIETMLCIGNVERLAREMGLDPANLISDKGSMFENYIAGLERFRDRPLVLSTTCDVPLLTGPILDDLVAQMKTIDAEVYYPIVNIKYFDEKFPGGKRTTQKLKEGTFTGGNVFAVNPEAVIRNRARVETVLRDRKSPAKLVRIFGVPFILRFALQQLDLAGLEAKATQILGARMRGVVTPHPEIGFDVDKPSDLNLVRKIMGHA